MLVSECNDILTISGWKRSNALSKGDFIAYTDSDGYMSYKPLENLFSIDDRENIKTLFIKNSHLNLYASTDTKIGVLYVDDETEFNQVKIKDLIVNKKIKLKKACKGIKNQTSNNLDLRLDHGTLFYKSNMSIYKDIAFNNFILNMIETGYSIDFDRVITNNTLIGYDMKYSRMNEYVIDFENDFHTMENSRIPLLGIKCENDEDVSSICIQREGKMIWVGY